MDYNAVGNVSGRRFGGINKKTSDRGRWLAPLVDAKGK